MATFDEALAQSGLDIPSINITTIGNWLIYVGVALLFAGIFAIGTYFIVVYFKYNKTVVLFRKINNNIERAFSVKGIFERVGSGGDYWLKTRRIQKILPRPKIQVAKNEHWYYEREDGEWINFRFKDIDKEQKEMGAYFVDEDMRLQRLGIQKNLKERYEKQGFWEKYGTTILSIGFVLIVMIVLIVLFNKITELVATLPALAQALESVANAMRESTVHSGVVPVNESLL